MQTQINNTYPSHLDLFPKKIVYHNHNNFQIGDRVDLLIICHRNEVLLQHNQDGQYIIINIHSNLCETIVKTDLLEMESGNGIYISLT
jgi:hypothetical protein